MSFRKVLCVCCADANAYFVAMSENTTGWYAHPDKNACAQAGEALAAFVENIKGW